ncbi:MAG TPA: PilZ domain-containing protein [Chitinispirillaceae bacterium]|nr:PilZ domain-containing protein [Chitinispirillaceae bacterium]
MDFIERRKNPRIDVDYVTVEVYTSNHYAAMPEVSEICNVINLSEKGMRFSTEIKFKTKQILRLTFLLPDSICIVRTNANVIHIIPKRRSTYEVGVSFINLGTAEKALIQHFVNKSLQSELSQKHNLKNKRSKNNTKQL